MLDKVIEILEQWQDAYMDEGATYEASLVEEIMKDIVKKLGKKQEEFSFDIDDYEE